MGDVLAFAEQRGGEPRRAAHEVVSAARSLADELGGDVHAVAIGTDGLAEGAGALGEYGADRVRVAESDAFENYQPDGFADVLEAAIREGDYDAVLFPATPAGKDLAPRVAARVEVPLATEATGLAVEDGAIIVTRPIYAGKIFATVTLDASPAMVSLRPNVFTAESNPREADVETVDAATDPNEWRVRVREIEAAGEEALDVAEAPMVVSGGRGMQGPENWNLLENLQEAIGIGRCALGASRAVVDAGWRPHAEQVGQTGKTVAPRLYIAVGISGAIQHLAGMRTAGTIVAINKDPDAPIFQVADYGIVGDAFEVVPALTEAIRGLED